MQSVSNLRLATVTVLFIGVTLGSDAGCRRAFNEPPPQSVVVTLQRTRCPEGVCPAYAVTLRGNGSVEYTGEWEVDIPGRQVGRVDPAVVRELVMNADAIGFSTMQDRYYEDCTDLPTTIISIQGGGNNKRVSSDYSSGCDPKHIGPQVDLAQFAEKIDSAAGTAHWIKCDAKCIADSIKSNLDVNSQSSYGETPLLVSTRRKELSKMMLLLDAGAKVDLADDRGLTPLMWAVTTQQPSAVRELLGRGANVNARDSKGFTASQMTGDAEILRLLAASRRRAGPN